MSSAAEGWVSTRQPQGLDGEDAALRVWIGRYTVDIVSLEGETHLAVIGAGAGSAPTVTVAPIPMVIGLLRSAHHAEQRTVWESMAWPLA